MKLRTLAIGLAAALAATAYGATSGASSGTGAGATSGSRAVDAHASPTTFIVRFKIKPGKNAEFERIMAKMQAALPGSEPGNIAYDLYLPSPDSQTYVLIEHYRDAAAVTAHGRDRNTQEMAASVKTLLDGPPSAERLILVSSKPQAVAQSSA